MNSLYDVYRAAIDVQTEQSFQAVTVRLVAIVTYLRNSSRVSADEINQHPAVILVVAKLADMTGGCFPEEKFGEAWGTANSYITEQDQKTKIGGMTRI